MSETTMKSRDVSRFAPEGLRDRSLDEVASDSARAVEERHLARGTRVGVARETNSSEKLPAVVEADEATACGPPEPGSQLALRGGHVLVVEHGRGEDVLRIVGANGSVTLCIAVTEQGPVLCFEGGLKILAHGDLTLEASHLAIHGREGLSVTSGGDVTIDTPGNLSSSARIQTITATLGDVSVRANDDVRVNGERVLVNC